MENTHIEWTAYRGADGQMKPGNTFNPWIGCAKVSPGCLNCYAAAQDKFRSWTPEGWGAGKPRKRTSEMYWQQPVKWDREAATAGERPRVFCASLADWLDDEVPIEWLADLLDLIRRTPNLDWLLLSKRPRNWLHRLAHAARWIGDEPGHDYDQALAWIANWLGRVAPANVWIGTTVEDQTRADERIPLLLSIPARVRFLSCEPLLGPVDLTRIGAYRGEALSALEEIVGTPAMERPSISWVIAGGESGPGARPMHPAWARSIRDQCAAAGVSFFMKQWGEWIARDINSVAIDLDPDCSRFDAIKITDTGENGSDLNAGGDNAVWLSRVGKKAAGRLLDGRTHDEFPATA